MQVTWSENVSPAAAEGSACLCPWGEWHERFTCCIFAGLRLQSRAFFSTCLRVNITPKPIVGKFCILFHPLPSNYSRGNVTQNETCRLPTSRGEAANTLDQFSSPILPSASHTLVFPDTRIVVHGGGGGCWARVQPLMLF